MHTKAENSIQTILLNNPKPTLKNARKELFLAQKCKNMYLNFAKSVDYHAQIRYQSSNNTSFVPK